MSFGAKGRRCGHSLLCVPWCLVSAQTSGSGASRGNDRGFPDSRDATKGSRQQPTGGKVATVTHRACLTLINDSHHKGDSHKALKAVQHACFVITNVLKQNTPKVPVALVLVLSFVITLA